MTFGFFIWFWAQSLPSHPNSFSRPLALPSSRCPRAGLIHDLPLARLFLCTFPPCPVTSFTFIASCTHILLHTSSFALLLLLLYSSLFGSTSCVLWEQLFRTCALAVTLSTAFRCECSVVKWTGFEVAMTVCVSWLNIMKHS